MGLAGRDFRLAVGFFEALTAALAKISQRVRYGSAKEEPQQRKISRCYKALILLEEMVGDAGFEPATR